MTETLGQRITRLRSEHGMSQGDLADALDISRQSVSKWETDTSTPELEKLIRLAQLFDISMDTLVLGKEPPTLKAPAAEEQPLQAPTPPPSVRLGYKREPILQTQKFVGVGLILVSIVFALICLTFYEWSGLLSAIILSSPLWGCGILCLCIRRHLGLWCAWTVFVMVTGYLYYATGTTRGAIWNPQFWIYGNLFRKITAVMETVLLIGLYLWTFLTFRDIRCSKHLNVRMKPLVGAYIGIVLSYVVFYAVLKIIVPRAILTSMAYAFHDVWGPLYHIFTFIVSAIDLLWRVVLLLGARMLCNEYKAAKEKTE